MANATFGQHRLDESTPNPAAFVNPIGAAISLAVLVGMVAWGASTLMRDAAGIPVVKRLEGPMRVAPQDPGGVPAENQGLTVNEIAGSSQTTLDSGSLTLAPQPASLVSNNQAVRTTDLNSGQELSASAEIEALAAQLAAVAQPLSTLESGTEPAVVTSLTPVSTGTRSAVARSLRPQVRPVFTTASVSPAPTPTAIEIAPAVVTTVAAGTRMAQLGAYETQAIAESEWARLSGRFTPYLTGKNHVIQTATRDGKLFYRLRVVGFADATEARRFCSALISQNADCYPTVMK